MADKQYGWRRFQRMKFSTKGLSKRARTVEAATLRHAHKFIFKRLRKIRNVRRHIASWLLLVGVLIGLTGLQLVWNQKSYTKQAPVGGGTYAEAVLGPIDTLNPLYATTDAELSASRLLFSSLYSYDTEGSLNADLASSMTRSERGDEYTIRIKENARWSDDTALTAADVVFTIDLLKNPMSRAAITGWRDIAVEQVDEYTVRFKLPSTYAPFRHALTFPILPKHALENINPEQLRESKFSKAPIGSGPFVFRLEQPVDINEDRKIIHMAMNESYYRGKPKLEKFQLHVYGSQEAIAKALRTNEVNAAADVSLDTLSEKDRQRYTILELPLHNGVYALMNTQSEVLKSTEVRRALQLLTDTEEIRAAMPNEVNSLSLPFLPAQVAGADLPSAPAVNRTEAEKLLDAAGYVKQANGPREKDGFPLTIKIATLKNKEYETALSAMAKQWRDAGIQVEAEVLDTSDVSRDVLQTVLQPRNFDVLIYELTMGADPDSYAYWHSSQITRRGLNFSNYANGIADDALSSARLRLEPDIRAAKYVAFAEQWLKDVPAIGLYQGNSYYVQNDSTRSVDESKARLITPTDRYGNVLYWTVRQGSVYKTP